MPLPSFGSIFGKTRTLSRISSAACLFASIAVVELGQGAPVDFTDQWIVPIYSAVRTPPPPLNEGDADGDGLSDEREAVLVRTFAPVVILDDEDHARPASVPWVLERTQFIQSAESADYAFDAETRKGSNNPEEWVTYVNVHPRVDGDILVEYWFYYPYNDGPLFFKHESDWERITVRLDQYMKPRGAYLARHENNAPGPFFIWADLKNEGSHPVIFSAKGTHATYANASDAAWFESISTCTSSDQCSPHVWRTWEGGGLSRLDDLPEGSVSASVFRFSGRWGAKGFWPGTSAPRGPMFQAGHCNGAFSTCRRLPTSEVQQAKL